MAARNGDLQRLMDVLAPTSSCSATAAKVKAALRPIHGPTRSPFLQAVAPEAEAAGHRVVDGQRRPGGPGLRRRSPGPVVSMESDQGRISRIYFVRNPDKLASLAEQADP